MRYGSLLPFLRHIEQASSDHLAPLYAIFSEDPEERRYLAEKIVQYLPGPTFLAKTWTELIQSSQELSLFSSPKVILFDHGRGEKVDFSLLKKLVESTKSTWIFTGKDAKVPPFFEEKGVLLTFFPEKKWKKEKRFTNYLQERAASLGKVLHFSAAAELLAKVPTDLKQLFSELDKTSCYVGTKKIIEKDDVSAIISSFHQESIWQKGEAFVWEKQNFRVEKAEISLFLQILRREFRTGYLLSLCDDRKKAALLFPKMWPSLLEKKLSSSHREGCSYFRLGLLETFYAELHFRKTSFFDPIILRANVISSS